MEGRLDILLSRMNNNKKNSSFESLFFCADFIICMNKLYSRISHFFLSHRLILTLCPNESWNGQFSNKYKFA